MKKLIVCLIMVCVIFSMTACGSEEKEVVTNPSETTVTSTETSDEVNVTESPNTEKVENTETTVTEPTTQESTSNKNEGNTNSNSNSGNGTSNKPSKPNTNENTESQKPSSKPSSGGNTTVKPTTPAKPTTKPTTPATKPTTKPTTPATKPAETKPYFVSLEYVSETRPNTFYVDGMDVLTRVYGKAHYAYQTGDTVTYKVNMSDGGNKGFEIYSTHGCSAKISGKNVIVSINGTANTASVRLLVDTKSGEEEIRIGTFRVYKPTENLDYHRYSLAIIYGENIGLEWVNGYTNHESGIFERVAPNEMFNTMDKLKNMGCTKFNCQTDSTEFQIIAGN